MTAEIAIMNKEAIALASDSAVTMSEEKGQKIFTSANKLFALSKDYPVGIMVYGNANFMGVPWETIIKLYRKKLNKKKFNILEEYANDFINFLERNKQLFPKSEQERYFKDSVHAYFSLMLDHIKQKVEKELAKKEKPLTMDEVQKMTSKIIKEHHDIWKDAELAPGISKTHMKDLIGRYNVIIEEFKKNVFQTLPITTSISRQLTEIAVSLFAKFTKAIAYSGISGVVIAGFGEKEIFPVLKSFDIEGMVNDKLKYKVRGAEEINFENKVSIMAFAQQEMVYAFMEGIDPYLQGFIEEYLDKIFSEYPKIIAADIKKVGRSEKQKLIQKLRKESNKLFKDWQKNVKIYRMKNYVIPIINVVSILPKDELAAMAEMLVNLTIVKRKMSMEAETVGGPIDVALISKGDGFIWIKRKHYFKPESNPQFIAKYYKEVRDEKK